MNWQFCTLEQAIQLNELGVTQKSLFYWNKPKSSVHLESLHYGWTSDAVASAFNSSELLVLVCGGLQHFSDTDPFCARKLANDLISNLINGYVKTNGMNSRLDKLFADEFPALYNNQNVVKSIT